MAKKCVVFDSGRQIELSPRIIAKYEIEMERLEEELAKDCHSVESYLAARISEGYSDVDIQREFKGLGLDNLADKHGLAWIRQIYFPTMAIEAEGLNL